MSDSTFDRVREAMKGSRLWPIVALLMDTHIDDLPNERLAKMEEIILDLRNSHGDGSPLAHRRDVKGWSWDFTD